MSSKDPETDSKYKSLHKKYIDQNKEGFRFRQLEKQGINLPKIVENSIKFRLTDYLYPYHLFLDSGETVPTPDGGEFTLPNTMSLYYRKRRSLLWLYSKKCSDTLTEDEKSLRDQIEKKTFRANLGFKLVGLLMLINVRPYRSLTTKSVYGIMFDVLFAYYGFYMWVLSNVVPYQYTFDQYKPFVQKCHQIGLKVDEVPRYDLSQMSINKCKFYSYDPCF
ncbi:unnamed protein product [Moneuplotes crassus]|uniref:Uncharacterized protein n=1 Tax=Euplotes crassus TaxID=5936 RepID=A0AAD1XV95_EUPCR|nr:unnamed protein product [Moneuplotes crassus]